MAGTDTASGRASSVEPASVEWALRGTQCPGCGFYAMTVTLDMGGGCDTLDLSCCECDYNAATARLDEIFDPYIRDTWPIAIWWRQAISKVMTQRIAPDAALDMPPFPFEALDADVDDDEWEDGEEGEDDEGCPLCEGYFPACADHAHRDPVPVPNYGDVIAKRAARLDQAMARYKAR